MVPRLQDMKDCWRIRMNKAGKEFRRLIDSYYDSLFRAKENGRMIGWCTSNFPQEIPESLGLEVCYPENHSATLANAKEGEKYIQIAESLGYSNDLCSYARINLGYVERFDSEVRNLPKPDFLLVSTNTCHQLLKWFEILKEKFAIPMFVIDIPQCVKGEVDVDTLDYVSSQMMEVAEKLALYTHTSFSMERLKEVMSVSSACGRKWHEIHKLIADNPSLINGFDLFVLMSLVVVRRGRKETLDVLNHYFDELSGQLEMKKSTFPGTMKKKVFLEGLTCWSGLLEMELPLLERGINLVSSTYTYLFGMEYESYQDMVKAYCSIPNALSFSSGMKLRKKLIEESKADGVIYDITRSCRIWCGNDYEMERVIQEQTSLPSVLFDGDQADGKNFSYAQYETRIQAFSEMMEEK